MGERKDQTDCHTSFRSETVCTQAYCMILWFGAVEFAGHVAELTRPFLHSHTHTYARACFRTKRSTLIKGSSCLKASESNCCSAFFLGFDKTKLTSIGVDVNSGLIAQLVRAYG